MRGRFYRAWIRLGIGAGGTLLALDSCDQNVRDTVLSGVEGAATTLVTTFVQAFFESVAANQEGDPTVVMMVEPLMFDPTA